MWNCVTGGGEEADRTPAKRDEAFAVIITNIDPSVLYIVGDTEDPAVCWERLKQHFDRRTLSSKLFLKKKFFRAKMEAGESLNVHLRKMKELTDQLAAIDSKITDEDQVVTLLGSLPERFNTIVTALEARADAESLTLEAVHQALINQELKHNEANGAKRDGDKGTALAAGKFPPKMGKRPHAHERPQAHGKFRGKCFGCQKFAGHVKKDCPVLKAGHSSSGDNVGAVAPEEDAQAADHYMLGVPTDSAKFGNWILDSGASRHMTNNREHMVDFIELRERQTVRVGDGKVLEATGIGRVRGKTSRGCEVTLNDVLFVPDLAFNLMSVSSLVSKGCKVTFNGNCARVVVNGRCIGEAVRESDKLYHFDLETIETCYAGVSKGDHAKLWHRRMAHLNESALRTLPGLVEGITDQEKVMQLDFCEPCAMGKASRLPFPKASETRANRCGEIVHTDVCGPMSVESLGGSKYFVTFIDDHSRYCEVHFLKRKSDVLEKFKAFDLACENKWGTRIKCIRSDCGGEYTGNKFEEYRKSRGIRHQATVPHSPQQNGVAERKNRTLCEAARVMLEDAKLPRKFWAEAVATAAYCQNRAPTKAVKGSTPHELWTGQRPSVAHLRIFGSPAYVLKEQHDKMGSKAMKCIHVGYIEDRKGYKVYHGETGRIYFRRNVHFNEAAMMSPGDAEDQQTSELDLSEIRMDSERGEGAKEEDPTRTTQRAVDQQPIRRSQREIRPPRRYGFDEFGEVVHFALLGCDGPTSYEEAMSSPERELWKRACDEEFNALVENETWELVPRPPGRNVIGGKWVFTRKLGSRGEVEKYKARFVARGFTQKAGIDFQETFSPTARLTTVRLLLQICVNDELVLCQMDVKSAYLNSPIDCELYVQPPEGYCEDAKLVCKLKKSLYGLKQSGRNWNNVISQYLREIGFVQSVVDSCVFKLIADSVYVIIVIWVDDLLIAASTEKAMTETKDKLIGRFQMKDLGVPTYFLGMNFDVTPGCIVLSQETFIMKLLEHYQMKDCNACCSPLNPGTVKSDFDGDSLSDAGRSEYRSIVGSLIHLVSCTRPDLSYCTMFLSQFMQNPNSTHLKIAMNVLRYLKGTVNYALKYIVSDDEELRCYTDSDWANLKDRRSVSGQCCKIGSNSSLISWKTKKQATVSLSTCEAEYVALSAGVQECEFLEQLYLCIRGRDLDVKLHVDNQSAIFLAGNPICHKRSKHIDVRHHYTRQYVSKVNVHLCHVASAANLADPLTKIVPVAKLRGLFH